MLHKTFIIVASAAAIFLSAVALAKPAMTLSPDSLDFGFSPQNQAISCRFWIRSTGTDTLKIADVRSSCGCTQAPLEKKIVPPGDSTMLEVTLATGQYLGNVVKSVHISTNTGEPERNVTISTTVLANTDSTSPVIIRPYVLDFSHPQGKNEMQATFTIQNVASYVLEPRIISIPDDIFTVKLPKRIKPGKTTEVMVRLKPNGPPHGFIKSFTIALNDVLKSRFSIPVRGPAIVLTMPPGNH